MLTVDVEEWADARLARIPAEERDRLPPSLEGPVDRLLELLEDHRARATFFVLGRVARRYPEMIRRVALAHEIASHGDSHEDLSRLSPEGFRRELRASSHVLEDQTGRKVAGFRAPNWSLSRTFETKATGETGTSWAFRVLEEEGFSFDSSLMPGRGFLFLRGRAGVPGHPHRPKGHRSLWEVPPTVWKVPGISLPIAGGAFLRCLPVSCALSLCERVRWAGGIPVLHVHPWELSVPPRTGLGPGTRALLFSRSRTVLPKLARILTLFRSVAIEDVLSSMDSPASSQKLPTATEAA